MPSWSTIDEMKEVDVGLVSLKTPYAKLRVSDRRREARLLASMEEHGQQRAVWVVPGGEGRYVVVDGHKRVRALRRLRRDVARVVVWEMPEAEALVAAYRTCSGGRYNSLEEGWLVYELHRVWKWGLGKAAASMGRSKSWASRRLGLVEGLPESVVAGVQRGEIGAWAAMKYLLPLARANGGACERLAGKIIEAGLSSRQVGLVCEHYGKGGGKVAERILEDPERFLKALEEARKGPQDPSLSEAENRAFNQMELIGNVALGLTRNLPQVLGYDAGEAARAKLWSAWSKSCKRLALLEEAAAALKAASHSYQSKEGTVPQSGAEGKRTARGSAQYQARSGNTLAPDKEDENAESGTTDGSIDAAPAGAREPQDRQGPWGGAQHGREGHCERPGAGGEAPKPAASA